MICCCNFSWLAYGWNHTVLTTGTISVQFRAYLVPIYRFLTVHRRMLLAVLASLVSFCAMRYLTTKWLPLRSSIRKRVPVLLWTDLIKNQIPLLRFFLFPTFFPGFFCSFVATLLITVTAEICICDLSYMRKVVHFFNKGLT